MKFAVYVYVFVIILALVVLINKDPSESGLCYLYGTDCSIDSSYYDRIDAHKSSGHFHDDYHDGSGWHYNRFNGHMNPGLWTDAAHAELFH